MPPKKKKRKASGAGTVAAVPGASQQELLALLQLLPLLRSGALPGPAPPQGLAPQPVGKLAQQVDRQPESTAQKECWKEVNHKKQKTQEKEAKKDEALEPADWSVPVREGISHLRSGEPGVCQATTAAGKQAVRELSSTAPLALVTPSTVCDASKELCVKVKDATGKVQVRQRFLTQLGVGEVVHQGKQKTSSAQLRVSVVEDTARVVLTAHSLHLSSENWAAFQARPQKTARSWLLQRAGAQEVVDVFPPTRVVGREGEVQVVAQVGKADAKAVLRASGLAGGFTREFYCNQEERKNFKVVPLPREQSTVQSARCTAENLGSEACGVVTLRVGLGVRVLAEDYKKVVQLIHKERAEQFLGERFKVSGVPLSWGKTALSGFLKDNGWEATPLDGPERKGFRRTWLVKAAAAPENEVLEFAEDTWLQIKPLEPRIKSQDVKIQKWHPATKSVGSNSARQAAPSWMEVAVGRQPPASAARLQAVEVEAEVESMAWNSPRLNVAPTTPPVPPVRPFQASSALEVQLGTLTQQLATLQQAMLSMQREMGLTQSSGTPGTMDEGMSLREEQDSDSDDDGDEDKRKDREFRRKQREGKSQKAKSAGKGAGSSHTIAAKPTIQK